MTARPKHQRKHDRIVYGGATTREEIAIDHAIAPFDRLARKMEKRWGVGGLVDRVSPATAARYGKTLASLNAAMDAQDIDRAVDRASACMRGMLAMEAEVLASGQQPPVPSIIEHDVDGFKFGIIHDPELWAKAAEEHPGVKLYTMREIGVALQLMEDRHKVQTVKNAFPGAEVVAMTPKRRGPMPDDPLDLIEEAAEELPF